MEEIARFVAQELEDIEPGCMHTICGGYVLFNHRHDGPYFSVIY